MSDALDCSVIKQQFLLRRVLLHVYLRVRTRKYARMRARARVLAYHRDAGYYRGTAVRHARALTYACEHAVYLLIPVHVLPGYGSAPGEESTGARWKSLQWHLSGAQSHWCVEIVFCDSPKLIALHWQDTQDGPIVGIADLEPRSERPVSSRLPARYALEMNRGWFNRHVVLEGDTIRHIPRQAAE